MAVLKYFLLHDDPVVRDFVGFRLYESWATDRELVPLVLEACERYGELSVLHLLGFACRFPMTHRAIEQTLSALGSSPPPFAELWIATAPLELLEARGTLVVEALSPRARARLARRRSFHEASPSELWRWLEEIAVRLDRDRAEPSDWETADDLVEALSRREASRTVLARLSASRSIGSPFQTLFDVELAGAMQLHAATPRLVDLLELEHEALTEAATKSLARMGNPALVRLLLERYGGSSWEFRRRALDVMKAVQLDVAERALLSVLDVEPSRELRARVFDALRFRFSARAAAALRRELRRPSSSSPHEELRKALFVFSRISGEVDEEAERFREEARQQRADDVLFTFPLVRDDRGKIGGL